MGIFSIYRDLRELGQCLALSLCCFVFIGPILAIAGVSLIVSAGTDTRAKKVDVYNAAVTTWTSPSGYATFLTPANQFTFYAPATGGSTMSATTLDTSSNTYTVDAGPSVSTYTVLARGSYTQRANNAPLPYLGSITSATPVTTALDVSDPSSGITSTLSNVPLGWLSTTFPCVSTDSRAECTAKCTTRGGSVPTGTFPAVISTPCNKYFLLSEVCVVAANNTGAAGAVIDTDAAAGYGCAIITGDVVGDQTKGNAQVSKREGRARAPAWETRQSAVWPPSSFSTPCRLAPPHLPF